MPNFLKDGLATVCTIGDTSYIAEKKVTPPGVDGGDTIDISHMRSGFNSIFWPRSRVKWTDLMITAAWSTYMYSFQSVQGGVAGPNGQSVNVGSNPYTLTFADGATLYFYGVLTKFLPQEVEEGQQPGVNLTVALTHTTSAGAIVAPLYNPGALS